MHDLVAEAYRDLLIARAILPDPGQEAAAHALQALAHRLEERDRRRDGLGGYFRRQEPAPRGLYLAGPVGRGKTMLMDLFVQRVAVRHKQRLHFDAFMSALHAAIDEARRGSRGDPIAPAVAALTPRNSLLCIDEFQVADIADAMILARVHEQLLARGVTLVATSNTAPEGLYKDGINRQLFLPFIERLLATADVIALGGPHDYRLAKLAGRPLYFTPLGPSADAALERAWDLMVEHEPARAAHVDVNGRKLSIARAAAGTAYMSFDELCARALGAPDYRAIAGAFHTLILANIPVLTPERRNEARRFTLLVDALYDMRRRLIASAAAEPDAIYPAGDGSEAFGRTASRLVEMRSADYLEAASAAAPAPAN